MFLTSLLELQEEGLLLVLIFISGITFTQLVTKEINEYYAIK
jgi:hypothetical protein